MARKFLVVDLFCGAGGLSEACALALKELGRPYKLRCLNHWQLAIDTHQANHPEAEHYCQDIAAARPITIVPEGYLDLLIAAPTCTFFSQARGGRPTSDQQRMDPWHIVTWLTELRVKRLLLENVPEIVKWGPVDPRTGRPIKSREGEYFSAWIAAIKGLGFKVEYRFQVCADFGDPTTRKRFMLQARSDGKPIVWPTPSHAKDPRKAVDLFAPAIVKPWRTARECIDWSIPGRSIYGRKYPLSSKTILRIYSGASKFRWPEPWLVVLRRHMSSRSIDLPIPTITAGGSHIGLAQPFLLGQLGERRARGLDLPVQAVTTIPRIGLIEPFICGAGGPEYAGKPVSANEPFRTLTTEDHRIVVAPPFMLAQAQGGVARDLREPMPAIPCGGAHALIAPYYSNGSGQSCKPVSEPLDTITATDRFGLVVPITHANGHGRVHSVDHPLPTLTTANRGELAFVTASFGERPGQVPRVHDIDSPLPAVLAQGHVNLASATLNDNDEADTVYDIHYRMLVSSELANAHSFNVARKYVFKGNKTQRNKQIGNSVPVLMGKAHVAAAFHDLRVAA